MHYEQIIDGCLAGSIGEHGLTDAELDPFIAEAGKATGDLRRNAVTGANGILALPARRDDIETFAPLAVDLRARFKTVIVLGTGGSGLGGKAITAIAAARALDTPALRFLDNLDPSAMDDLLVEIDFASAAFLVISKSGTTPETLAQYFVCYDAARHAVGADVSDHFIAITDPTDSPLRRIAVERGHTVLDHDPGVGGRFSVLSTVGMLPAAVAGLDVAAIRSGAAAMLEHAFDADADTPSPALGAAVSLALARHHGANMSVLMPYGDRLDPFAAWYRQLWAESLGKQGLGTTPIRALGPVDQHSQLQLYLDGPRDKMFTIVQSAMAGMGPTIPTDAANDPATAYLSEIRIGDLVAAQQQATAETLVHRGRPTRVLKVERLDESTMGALFMHFMLETIIAARILGVDAFDQPAVDEGKALTRGLLNNSSR